MKIRNGGSDESDQNDLWQEEKCGKAVEVCAAEETEQQYENRVRQQISTLILRQGGECGFDGFQVSEEQQRQKIGEDGKDEIYVHAWDEGQNDCGEQGIS